MTSSGDARYLAARARERAEARRARARQAEYARDLANAESGVARCHALMRRAETEIAAARDRGWHEGNRPPREAAPHLDVARRCVSELQAWVAFFDAFGRKWPKPPTA